MVACLLSPHSRSATINQMGECVDLDDPIGEVCDPDVDAGNVELGENDKVCAATTSQ